MIKTLSKIIILCVIILFSGEKGWGQVSLTNSSNSVTIDFSATTPSTVGTNPTSAFTGAGFSPNPTTAGRLNSNAWATTGWSDGALNFGNENITGDHARGSTSTAVTTGGIYAYTGTPQSSANPCLMIQPSGGDWAPGTLTLRIINNGSSNITAFDISYNIYIRNDQSRANSFNFSYSTDNSTYIQIGSMNYTSPETADANGWVLVGTAPSRSTTITGLNISPGSYFYIRWFGNDVSGTGLRDEFGLDDISITATFSTSSSSSSDIIRNTGFTEPSNIPYASYQETDLNSSSLEVAQFDIRDGGGSPDGDSYGTTLTAITFSITNWANLRRLAIYDGTTEVAETAVSSGSVSFSGLSGLTAPDDGSKTFSLRASFQSTVTDNQQFQFTITAATADPSGSTFASANAGGAQSSTTGDRNRIEVTATKLRFVQQPTNVTAGVAMSPAVTVEAADANNNRDLDYTTQITVTSTGMLSGSPVSAAPSAGLATFASLIHTGNGNGFTLNAISGTLSSATSSTFNVLTNNLSDIIETPGFEYSSNIGYHLYQESDDIQLTETSIEVFGMRLRDGGASGDADTAGTMVTQIELSVTHPDFIRRAALYHGNTELAEIAVSGSPIQFTGLSVIAPDEGYIDLTLRVSFTASVTDNQQVQFTVTSVTASAAGSGFAAANGGGAQSNTSGDINRIEVTAVILKLSTVPFVVSVISPFSLTVTAMDNNEIEDLDFTGSVSLVRYTGNGVLTSASGLTQNLVAGTRTWNDLKYDRLDSNVSIRTENNSGLLNDTTGLFTVVIFRETMGSVGGTTAISTHENNNGFDQDVLTYSGNADVRNTTPSTDYSNASGLANIFITNTSGTHFLISGLDTRFYEQMQLSFGIHKSTTASNGSDLIVEVSSDGSSYTPLSFPALPTGPGTATWYYRTASGTIPSTANLRIRFRQNGTSTQFRIDDVLLNGINATPGLSDLVASGNEAVNIDYAAYQSSVINTTGDAVRVWSFTIRDGGQSSPDPDNLGTTMTEITIGKGADNSVSSWTSSIRRAALFDGSTKVADINVNDEVIYFSGLSGVHVTAPDNGTKTLDLYLTFETSITDNQQYQFKILTAKADPAGSAFASPSSGFDSSSIYGDRNRLEVNATRLTFSNEPSVAYVNAGFSLTITAVDNNGNTDLDATPSVTLQKHTGSGNLSSASGLTQNLVSGSYSWTDLIWNTVENNVSIRSTNSSGLTNDTTALFNVLSFATYTWNQTGTASFTVPTNWTPMRNTPASTDLLQFNNGANTTVTNVPAQTIGKLVVSGNTTVNLQAGGTNTLTINGLGAAGLEVEANSQLNISGTNALTIFLNTGTTAQINGTMTFSNGPHRLNAQAAQSIRFRNGSVLTQASGCTGNIFTNTGTANVAVFESGSRFISQAGANPFGLTAPASKVIFQSGSTYLHQQSASPSFSGRTYANIEINFASFNQSATGTSLLVFDSLIMTQGTLNLNLTGGIHIKGSLNIKGGSTLTFSPAATNTITFNGASLQKIYGLGTLTFNANTNVTVHNNSNLQLERNITLNGVLTLSAGKIRVQNGTLTFSSTASVTGGNNNRFIEGRVARVFPVSASSQSFEFPTGSRTDIQPVTITLATVSASAVTITSEQINENPYYAVSPNINTATIDNISGVRYWNITKSGGSFTNAQVTLTYVQTPGNSDSVQYGSELRIAQLDNSNVWQLIGGVGSANWQGTITSNTFNDFQGGYFTFADPLGGLDITLPVELAYYRVEEEPRTGKILLSWRTESELNNAYFLIQRAIGNAAFSTIATIRGQGTKTAATDYQYYDDAPKADTLVYRIADVAYDGTIFYHPPKVFIRQHPVRYYLFQNYPNPFNASTTLMYQLPRTTDVRIEIYNALGEKVKTLVDEKNHPAGRFSIRWDGTNDQRRPTASGLYIARIRAGSYQQSVKLLFMK